MARRSIPQKQIDVRAFPIGAFSRVPENGFGKAMEPIHQWLDHHVGRGQYAWHSGSSQASGDSVALYFRAPGPLRDFCARFPDLQLTDGDGDTSYTSPNLVTAPGSGRDDQVCHLYNRRRSAGEVRQTFKGQKFTSAVGNMEPGDVYPNSPGPIIRHDTAGGLELVMARWGMPSPAEILKTQRDLGVYNVRNLRSPRWRRWLGPVSRCLVPVTSFAETRGTGLGNQWFAPGRPRDGDVFRRHRDARLALGAQGARWRDRG
jgi:hypothetical protein